MTADLSSRPGVESLLFVDDSGQLDSPRGQRFAREGGVVRARAARRTDALALLERIAVCGGLRGHHGAASICTPLVEQIKDKERLAPLPLVLVSAAAPTAEDIQRAFACGMLDVVEGAAESPLAWARLQALLERTRTEREVLPDERENVSSSRGFAKPSSASVTISSLCLPTSA